MTTTFAFLKDCKPLDLVRVNLGTRSDIALVGEVEDRNFQALVVLSPDRTPSAVNLRPHGQIDKPFAAHQALSYGGNYVFGPHYIDLCDVATGPLFQTAGAYILAGEERFLAVEAPEKQLKYFNLDTGKLQDEPMGGRAAFGWWALYWQGKEPALFMYKVEPAKTTKPARD